MLANLFANSIIETLFIAKLASTLLDFEVFDSVRIFFVLFWKHLNKNKLIIEFQQRIVRARICKDYYFFFVNKKMQSLQLHFKVVN